MEVMIEKGKPNGFLLTEGGGTCLCHAGLHLNMKKLFSLVSIFPLIFFHATLRGGTEAEDNAWTEAAAAVSRPLAGDSDLDELIRAVGSRRVVLLGEASHGTHEFYHWRDKISRRLIAEKGFSFIAVEGDWAALSVLNRYVKHRPGAPADAETGLGKLDRWPEWMWANRETVRLLEWLREHNRSLDPGDRVGFHGMDVYDPWRSMDRVLDYLDTVNPEAAASARGHYREWARYRDDGHRYARAVDAYLPSAEEGAARVVALVRELRAGEGGEADRFDALQNAKVVQNAERHFRKMAAGGAASWNARVDHMKQTVTRLREYHGPDAKGIVWAHNTHIGDARATSMAGAGQRNMGQLARVRWGEDDVFAVGFGTGAAEVMAGRSWGAPPEIMRVPEPLPGSVEDLLGRLGGEARWLRFDAESRDGILAAPRPHRAIGVVYQPEHDHRANHVPTSLARRYDAFLFFPTTRALDPLEEVKRRMRR